MNCVHEKQRHSGDNLSGSTWISILYSVYFLFPCRLESTALLLADEFNPQQALILTEGLEEIQCRNLKLINK